jgi:hypothetical protein
VRVTKNPRSLNISFNNTHLIELLKYFTKLKEYKALILQGINFYQWRQECELGTDKYYNSYWMIIMLKKYQMMRSKVLTRYTDLSVSYEHPSGLNFRQLHNQPICWHNTHLFGLIAKLCYMTEPRVLSAMKCFHCLQCVINLNTHSVLKLISGSERIK